MIDALSQLHFLRPLWLLALVPCVLLAWLLWRQRGQEGDWSRVVAPELLSHLISEDSVRRSRSGIPALLALWCVAVLAAAGPSWQQIPQPVLQKQDALVLMVDLSYSMLATDLEPSRQDRVRRKLLDLLRDRREGLTALIAYAGDAHVVAPLTDDNPTIANLLPALNPAMMPLPGSNPADAIDRALALLDSAGVRRGRLLLVTDGLTEDDTESITQRLEGEPRSLAILGVGTDVGAPIPLPDGGFLRDRGGEIVVPALDRQPMQALARAVGGAYKDLSVDDSDLDTLLAPDLLADDENTINRDRQADRWEDMGHWLVIPLLLAALVSFRRGWVYSVLLCITLGLPSPDTQAGPWEDLWQTRDQQGRRALQNGNADAAAALFEDPRWQATAAFEAQDYDTARRGFAAGDSADDWYNLGNTLAAAGDYEGALNAYDESLERAPDRADAMKNRQIVEQLKEQQQQEQNQQSQQGDSQNSPEQSEQNSDSQQNDSESSDPQSQESQNGDGNENDQEQGSSDPQRDQKDQQRQEASNGNRDEQGSPGSESQSEAPELSTPQPQIDTSQMQENIERDQAMEQWLRRVPDDPSGLLREKFRYESRRRQQQSNDQRQGTQRDKAQIW